ncbi:MAG: hypothetical protein AAFU54_14860 [Chloroflexota bacterium]
MPDQVMIYGNSMEDLLENREGRLSKRQQGLLRLRAHSTLWLIFALTTPVILVPVGYTIVLIWEAMGSGNFDVSLPELFVFPSFLGATFGLSAAWHVQRNLRIRRATTVSSTTGKPRVFWVQWGRGIYINHMRFVVSTTAGEYIRQLGHCTIYYTTPGNVVISAERTQSSPT